MEKTICIFGDSITWGASDEECGGWANRLEAYCFADKLRADIYNLGIPGNTTRDLLERVEQEIAMREPTHILFAIGINDSRCNTQTGESKISLQEFTQNIEKLTDIVRHRNMSVAFVGLIRVDEAKTNPRPHRPEASYRNERIAQYDRAIEDFCRSKDILYLSVATIVNKEELPDGLHPNASGHRKLFEAIKIFLGI